jgi:hypothetical protein
MAGGSRRQGEVALAIVLVLEGGWLLYVGAWFVSAWLTYEAQRSAFLNSGPTCIGCKQLASEFGLMPSPGLVSLSYLVAIPAILGIAWWTHRGSQLRLTNGQTVARLQRVGSDVLMGAMGWMVFLSTLGFVWPGLPILAPVGGPPIPWSLFLISVLVVPVIVVGVGVAFLWDRGLQRSRVPSQAVRG